ncbi:MAG: segregation/condensation protein A [archaeon]
MQEKIYDMLMKQDEISWKDIIYGLVKSEEMDPWDVDVSVLTQKYIQTLKNLQEMNFFLGGKVLLASAILVRIKSHRFIEQDISDFDNYLFHQEEEDLYEDDIEFVRPTMDVPPLAIKTPQPRKRKVSVTDLILALEKALTTNKRKILKMNSLLQFHRPTIPVRKVDIDQLIIDMLEELNKHFQDKDFVSFHDLVKGKEKMDTVLTLLPLLHLENEQKIHMIQEKSFSEIKINPKADPEAV